MLRDPACCGRHAASLAEVADRVYQSPANMETTSDPDRQEAPMNAQIASDLVLAYVGLVVVLGVAGVAVSFFFLGRQNYRDR
ncbi:hypothetical protein GCM10022240_19000 [Microbacterium kribbense]|uniref:Uncharacterized protein n=1 Tax=Microbacterium kribbense TaxID=433645 RepID=A0ABP7GKN7_9MICO